MTKTFGTLNPASTLSDTHELPMWDGAAAKRITAANVRTTMLTVPEASKVAAHLLLGLPDRIGPKSTGVAATDTAAVQAFYNACSPGDNVVFPPDLYLFNAVISVPANVTTWGTSNNPTWGTTFKMANSANLAAIFAADTWFSAAVAPTLVGGEPINFFHCTFDGNRTNNASGAGDGLVIMNYDSIVHRCNFIHCGGSGAGAGLRLTGYTLAGNQINNNIPNIRVLGCRFNDNLGAAFFLDEFSTTSKIPDGYFKENIIDGADAAGVSSGDYGILMDIGAGWHVSDNHVFNVLKSSCKIGRAFRVEVCDNYFEGYGGSTAAGTYCAIDFDTSQITNLGVVKIDGNHCYAPSTSVTPHASSIIQGIGCQVQSSATTAFVQITNNTVLGRSINSTSVGIKVYNQGAGPILYLEESNNTVATVNSSTTWDTAVLIGSADTIIAHSSGGTGQPRFAMTTFSATPLIVAAKVECAAQMWGMTLTANITAITMSAGVRDGQEMNLLFVQDGTGSRTVTSTLLVGYTAIASGANVATMQRYKYVANYPGGAKLVRQS